MENDSNTELNLPWWVKLGLYIIMTPLALGMVVLWLTCIGFDAINKQIRQFA